MLRPESCNEWALDTRARNLSAVSKRFGARAWQALEQASDGNDPCSGGGGGVVGVDEETEEETEEEEGSSNEVEADVEDAFEAWVQG